MDKATVLEDATNYIRELQDRVKELEGLSLIKRKETKDCIIASDRSRIRGDDDGTSSSNETNSVDCGANVTNKPSVEIEVRMLCNTPCFPKVKSKSRVDCYWN
ncbi:putative transcription factor bHLH family [Helianthus annuus]|nr:putative transcription factor bHLH family [Helianthus annuus]KAJ0683930.1 putative transcription factor bHLH family [Helianthus annuus]KAJ0687885.1 putative transcription factor bHLH family [Helianthus annuus]